MRNECCLPAVFLPNYDYFNAETLGQSNCFFFNFCISDTICYDDACHLKKFSQNPKRNNLTTTAIKMSNMVMVCDRFHFKNHIDAWCKQNCNPNTCAKLQVTPNIICLKKIWPKDTEFINYLSSDEMYFTITQENPL